MGNLLSTNKTNGGTLKFDEIYSKNSSDFKSYLNEKLKLIGDIPEETTGIIDKLKDLRDKSYKKEQEFLENFYQNEKPKNSQKKIIYDEEATSLTGDQEKELKRIFYGISSDEENEKNKNKETNSTKDGYTEEKGRQSLIECLLHKSFNPTVRLLTSTILDNQILQILEDYFRIDDNKDNKDNSFEFEPKNNFFSKLLTKIISKENIDNKTKTFAIIYANTLDIEKEVVTELKKLKLNFLNKDRKKLIKWYSELSKNYTKLTADNIIKALKDSQKFLNDKREEKGEQKYTPEKIKEGTENIKSSITQKLAGYVGLIKGSIAEILATTVLNQVLSNNNEMKAFITGDAPIGINEENKGFFPNTTEKKLRTKNKDNQSGHSDITIFSKSEDKSVKKYGIQVKFYSQKIFDFYGNSTYKIDNSNNLGRYIGKDVLEAFYMFTGLGLNINKKNKATSLIEDYNEEYDKAIEYVTTKYADFFQNRVSFFIRFEDISASDLLKDVQNNFFIINFEIIPTSIIINNMIEMVKLENNQDIFIYNNLGETEEIDDSKDPYKGITEVLKNKSVTFKGIKLNLNNLVN